MRFDRRDDLPRGFAQIAEVPLGELLDGECCPDPQDVHHPIDAIRSQERDGERGQPVAERRSTVRTPGKLVIADPVATGAGVSQDFARRRGSCARRSSSMRVLRNR